MITGGGAMPPPFSPGKMKIPLRSLLAGLLLGLVLLSVAAVVTQSTGLYLLLTTTDEIPLKVRVPSGQTANLLELVTGSSAVFSVSAAGGLTTPAFQSGTVTTAADGTVTNTFATAFAARPVVVATQYGALNSPTNWLQSITTTNFVLSAGAPGITNAWFAYGAP